MEKGAGFVFAFWEGRIGEIHALERQLMAWHRTDATSQRLETIPGVGLITATALAASVPDPSVFKSGRQFAAFLVWCRARTRPVARTASGTYPKWATAICGVCW